MVLDIVLKKEMVSTMAGSIHTATIPSLPDPQTHDAFLLEDKKVSMVLQSLMKNDNRLQFRSTGQATSFVDSVPWMFENPMLQNWP